MGEKKKKEKKEKVRYIDDGRTIADMSALGYARGGNNIQRGGSSFKDKWNTYWSAVRMMLLPMLVVIGILTATYLIMYFALS